MAQLCPMTNDTVESAIASAGFALFLTALPFSTSLQGCFLSPLSIVFALSLGLNGAGPNSSTQLELLRAISGQNGQTLSEADLNSELSRAMAMMSGQCTEGIGSTTADNTTTASQFVLANSIWTRSNIELKPAYVEAMKTLYQATAREAVNGAQDINDWVSEVTRGMIKDLVQSDDFDAILANAIYFKGLWKTPFETYLTQSRDFTTLGGAVKKVDMMQKTFERTDSARLARKEGMYDAVSLPYTGGSFRAVALLPAVGVQMATALKDWGSGQQGFTSVGQLHVMLPKFKVKSRMSLVPVLQSLGVHSAFSSSADFSRMSDWDFFINGVVHEAVVEVDEEGTVAAAATAGMFMSTSIPPPPAEVIFDRPFAFMIYHNPTNLPVFVGVVHDPSAAT